MMSVGVMQKALGGVGQVSRFAQTSTMRILGSYRTLFAADSLGIDGYERQRERTKMQFSGMTDKFRTKMLEFSASDSKSMVFTEDLKNMLHLVEPNQEDLQLIVQMMRKFNQQNKHLRFGNFVFGPVVMRMYHYLNDPKGALEAFNDPGLEEFFDQLVTYQILLDLLYRNQMYTEMLEVFEVVKTKQIQMTKFPRNVMILVFAALNKMNTVQSYELACKLLTEMKEVGVEPVRRALTFASSLAIKQNAPNVALEILSIVSQPNYVTVRNLKILALADIGRPDDALPILRWSLELDSSEPTKASVCPNVVERVAAAVEKLDNKEVTAEFQRVMKALRETGHISESSLDELLEVEITRPTNFGPPGHQNTMQRLNMEKSFRLGRSIDMKPRRNTAWQQREQRSIQYE